MPSTYQRIVLIIYIALTLALWFLTEHKSYLHDGVWVVDPYTRLVPQAVMTALAAAIYLIIAPRRKD